jgi:hypothetical protein
MNRFFFHFWHREACIRDTLGRECVDLAAARDRAVQLINKMVSLDDVEWQGWSIRIADVEDRSVLSVLFPQICLPERRNGPVLPPEA